MFSERKFPHYYPVKTGIEPKSFNNMSLTNCIEKMKCQQSGFYRIYYGVDGS